MSTDLRLDEQNEPRVLERPSGLVVPDTAVAREAWTKDDVRLFVRTERLAKARGLALVAVCRECQQHLQRVEVTGGFEMRCKCKTRVYFRT